MKERLILALSWFFFAHTSLLAFVIVTSIVGIDLGVLGLVGDVIDSYGDLFPVDGWLLFGLLIIGWIGLWIVTGSPRILPWKQVTDDD